MLCIKCKEEIYETKICPFCGQNQKEEVIQPKFEKPELSFDNEIKTCINCTKTFSKTDPECQVCPAMKDKLLTEDIPEEDIRKETKKSNKKAIYILCIVFLVFFSLIILSIGAFTSKIKDISTATISIMEDNFEYFKDENGEITIDFSAPLDQEIAYEFMTNVITSIYDVQEELFKLNEALNTYSTYGKFNILENNCEEINKRIKEIRKKYKEINTYDDPHLVGAKEYMYDKYFKPYYTYLNTVTLGIIEKNTNNLNTANLPAQPQIDLGFSINFATISTRADITQPELEDFYIKLRNSFIDRIKPYYYRMPEKQQKTFSQILSQYHYQ